MARISLKYLWNSYIRAIRDRALGLAAWPRYASVFILDRLPVHQNGFRTADDALADLLGEWTARDYSALGYRVVRVPVMSPEERLAFVLESLRERLYILTIF